MFHQSELYFKHCLQILYLNLHHKTIFTTLKVNYDVCAQKKRF